MRRIPVLLCHLHSEQFVGTIGYFERTAAREVYDGSHVKELQNCMLCNLLCTKLFVPDDQRSCRRRPLLGSWNWSAHWPALRAPGRKQRVPTAEIVDYVENNFNS